MKNLSNSLMFVTILIFCSGSLVSQAQKTNFGILSVRPDINTRLTAANNAGVGYVRESQLLSKWNGTNNGYIDFWLSHGKKVILNINNDSTPSFFPTDLVAYEAKLRDVLDTYAGNLELVAIENEELNDYDSVTSNSTLYHYGSIQDYINELTVAVNVCVEKGVPVTNGGLTTPLVASLKHYYDVNGKTDSSAWLMQQMQGVSPDSALWKRTDSLLSAYQSLPLSYVNLHWYEPLKNMSVQTGVLPTLCNYITQKTGKKVITNETGVKTADSSFVIPLMKQWDTVNVKYCIFFDGSGSFGAFPLTTTTGTLLTNGVAFRNYNFGTPLSCLIPITITPLLPVGICQGGNVTISAAAGFGNYLWSNGATSQNITVNAAGNYSVTSNQGICTAFSLTTAVVNVNPLPTKPTITPGGSTSNVCPSKTLKLTASPSPFYLWNTGETTKIININAGNYAVTVTDANGCKNTSDVTVVTAQKCNAPTDLAVTNITNNKATLNWDTATCSVGYQFQYRPKNTSTWIVTQVTGGAVSFRNLFSLTPSTTYQWKVLTGCKITPDTVASNYATGPEFTTSSSFAMNDNNAENLTGANVLAAKIFPNPVTTTATVNVTNPGNELKIVLTDISGRIIWQSEKITGNNINIPVKGLANGLYTVIVKNKEYSKMLRLVKE